MIFKAFKRTRLTPAGSNFHVVAAILSLKISGREHKSAPHLPEAGFCSEAGRPALPVQLQLREYKNHFEKNLALLLSCHVDLRRRIPMLRVCEKYLLSLR